MSHQVRIREQYPRRVFMRLENSDRFSGLHQQSLVVRQRFQRRHDRVIAIPVPGSLAGSAIYHQVLRTLRNLLVEIVHQHPHGRLLRPAFARQARATRCADRGFFFDFCVYRHTNMVVATRFLMQSHRQLEGLEEKSGRTIPPVKKRGTDYHSLYGLPSLPTRLDPLWTSLMPGSVWFGSSTLSSCTGTQVSSRAVKGSFGMDFMYPAETSSCNDCGAFCLSSVY